MNAKDYDFVGEPTIQKRRQQSDSELLTKITGA